MTFIPFVCYFSSSLSSLSPLLPLSFVFLYLRTTRYPPWLSGWGSNRAFNLTAAAYVPRSRMRYWNARSAKKSFSDRYRRKWWYIYVTDVYDPFVICRSHASWIKVFKLKRTQILQSFAWQFSSSDIIRFSQVLSISYIVSFIIKQNICIKCVNQKYFSQKFHSPFIEI